MFMGMSSAVFPPSLSPLPATEKGLNSDSTLAIFALSGDVSGCLENQQIGMIGMAVAFLYGCFVALSASQ